MNAQGKLVAVICGGKKHLEFIKAGYKMHHLDGRVVYLSAKAQMPLPKLK